MLLIAYFSKNNIGMPSIVGSRIVRVDSLAITRTVNGATRTRVGFLSPLSRHGAPALWPEYLVSFERGKKVTAVTIDFGVFL